MSTPNPHPPALRPRAKTAAASSPGKREIRSSAIAASFIGGRCGRSGFDVDNHHVVRPTHGIGPSDTTAMYEKMPADLVYNKEERKKHSIGEDQKVDVLVVPGSKKLLADSSHPGQPAQPRLHMTTNKNLGVLFVVVLLLVIAITNIPLRGLWSVIVIVFLISIVIIFALLEWWETILTWLGFLDIRINAAGYLVVSIVLFGLWLAIMVFFDRQVYMVFTPGQLRVRQEIGDAETAFDTTGMTIQKQRSDLFRHWILGLGSGDLIVKTAGAHPQEFHMPNVLFIGSKVAQIEDMLRQRQVVTGKPTE